MTSFGNLEYCTEVRYIDFFVLGQNRWKRNFGCGDTWYFKKDTEDTTKRN